MWRKSFFFFTIALQKNASRTADDLACIFIDTVDLYDFVHSYRENFHVWWHEDAYYGSLLWREIFEKRLLATRNVWINEKLVHLQFVTHFFVRQFQLTKFFA